MHLNGIWKMVKGYSENIYIWLLFISAVFIYITSVLSSFHRPLLGDEVGTVVGAANSLSSLKDSNIAAWSNTFEQLGIKYRLFTVYLYAIAFKIFGFTAESGRLVGVLLFFAILSLIYKTTTCVFKDKINKQGIGLIACSLYAINPFVIQVSSMVVEANTITFTSTLFLYAFLKTYQILNIRNLVLVGILFALALLTKFTIFPFLIIPIFILSVIDKGFKKSTYEISVISIIGIGLFLLVWVSYSNVMNIPFHVPFVRYKEFEFLSSSGLYKQIFELGFSTVVTVLWESPFFLLLGVLATGMRIKEFLDTRRITLVDFLILYIWLIFFVCLFLGISWGMPMYQFPIMPALSIVVAYFLTQDITKFNKKDIILCSVLVIFFTGYNIIVVGDWLYSINYTLKEGLINNTISTVLPQIILKLFLCLLPLPLIFLMTKKIFKNDLTYRSTINFAMNLSLFILLVSTNLAMNIMQMKADYNINFGYGGKGTRELFNFLEKNLDSNSVVLANYDVVYNYNIRKGVSPYFPNKVFKSSQLFIETAEKERPQCIVIGIPVNGVYTMYQVFKNQEVQSFLQQNFEKIQIGSYTIWMRRYDITPRAKMGYRIKWTRTE